MMANKYTKLRDSVDAFAEAMKRKLYSKVRLGWTGWDDDGWIEGCCTRKLAEHVDRLFCGDEDVKDDVVDIANFAMFIWARQERAKAKTGKRA